MGLRNLTVLVIIVCVAFSTTNGFTPRVNSAAPAPNFVVIVVDDLDSNSVKFMPTVERDLVAAGASFSDFFATTPLCCPSRASILRGQYAHNHGVFRNTGQNAGFAAFSAAGEESNTLATMLDGAGYATALVGKYLNGYSATGPEQAYIPPGWDYWVAGVDHEAYSGFNYALNVNGEIVKFGGQDEDYSTDVLSRYAADFLNQSAGSGQPFFLYLAPYAPHSPMPPAPRHKGMFKGDTAPRPAAFDERNVRDKPQWVRETPRFSDAKVSRIDEEYERRLESLQAVDDMVGSVVQHLADAGVLDSTYIFFLSDNGMFLGEHRQPHGKDAPYDPAARIPLVVSGPTVAAGINIDRLALNIDLMPTIADLSGLTPPDFVDGRSLTPLLSGGDATWRQVALLEGFGNETESLEDDESATPAFRALRSKDVLYVEYETGEREYYDLRRDSQELSNLAQDTAKHKLRDLSHRLDAISTCGGSACRALEDESLPTVRVAGHDYPQRKHKKHRGDHAKAHHAISEASKAAPAAPQSPVGGSTESQATFHVRMPRDASAGAGLVLQVHVASVIAPGTLVASLEGATTFDMPNAPLNSERLGAASVDHEGWTAIDVSDLYGDSGPFQIALSGRDGTDLTVSSGHSKLAPRLTTREESDKTSYAKHSSARPKNNAHRRGSRGLFSE